MKSEEAPGVEKRRILLVGGGGHCRSVLDCLLSLHLYDAVGIVERDSSNAPGLLGIPVVGYDADLPRLFSEGWTYAAVTLGSIGNPTRRKDLFYTLKSLGFTLPSIIDPSAVIGQDTVLNDGVFVGKRAVVNSGTTIGLCTIVNTGAILEHDCRIGNFVHIAPGSVLCGDVKIGDNTHIGAGAVIRQQIIVQRNSLIGAGSVIIRDIPESCTVVGNPGRKLERNL